MARISMLTAAEFPDDLREAVAADKKTPLELGNLRIYAHRPELALAYVGLTSAMRAPGLLDRRLIELVRLRVAFHNQCRSCMAVRYSDGVESGVDETLVCQLEQPDQGEDLTAAERAALHFADLLSTNHHAIDESTFDLLRGHFSEPEIVELGMNVALFVGFGRLSMAWDMVDELPAAFRERSEAIGPWSGEAVTV